MRHQLETEILHFEKNRVHWFKHHPGKFALVKREVVRGFYDTEDEAYRMGVDLFGMVPFLIKEVQLEDAVMWMRPGAIVLKVEPETDGECKN